MISTNFFFFLRHGDELNGPNYTIYLEHLGKEGGRGRGRVFIGLVGEEVLGHLSTIWFVNYTICQPYQLSKKWGIQLEGG